MLRELVQDVINAAVSGLRGVRDGRLIVRGHQPSDIKYEDEYAVFLIPTEHRMFICSSDFDEICELAMTFDMSVSVMYAYIEQKPCLVIQ